MPSAKFKRYLLLVARGQQPVADLGMANPFHQLLPSRPSCDFLTLQRNFLGMNLIDGAIFTALNFKENGALKSAENSDFFHVKKIFMHN